MPHILNIVSLFYTFLLSIYSIDTLLYPYALPLESCYDLKLKLRLHLSKDLRKDKECIEVVKHKDTG